MSVFVIDERGQEVRKPPKSRRQESNHCDPETGLSEPHWSAHDGSNGGGQP